MTYRNMGSLRRRRLAILVSGVLGVMLLVALAMVPAVRTRLESSLGMESGSLMVGGEVELELDEAENGGSSKKRSGFRRIVTAPVRLFAGLFRRKSDPLAVREASGRDIEKMRIIPMQRNRDGLGEMGGMMADTSGAGGEGAIGLEAAQELFDEAVSLHDRGQIDTALEKLVAATALRDDFAEAHNLMGVCYDRKRQFESAQTEYRKALSLDGRNARYYNNLGYSYYLAGNDGSAIRAYRKGLKITPHDRRMQNNIGLSYGRKGDFRKAREYFLAAVGETGAQLNLGFVYAELGMHEEAIRQYQLALQAQPQSLTAIGQLSQLYERTGRLREAAQLGEQYRRIVATNQQKEQTVDQ